MFQIGDIVGEVRTIDKNRAIQEIINNLHISSEEINNIQVWEIVEICKESINVI
jgi:hypothetical protein